MPLSLDFCDDADIARVTEILFDAFGTRNHYINTLYPHHDTPNGRAGHCERLLSLKLNDATSRWLKVTDTSTGKIIGQAMWQVYVEKPPETPLTEDFWGNDEEKEYGQDLYRAYRVPRRRLIRAATGPVLCLAMLSVDPDHQHRGAGTMMVNWGLELADKIGAEATVEATLEGRHLYEQRGFVMQEYFTLVVSERWANRPKVRLFFMHRPKRVV
ncbi:acyl-CoA N-acyltransferase [Usnea florida]